MATFVMFGRYTPEAPSVSPVDPILIAKRSVYNGRDTLDRPRIGSQTQ